MQVAIVTETWPPEINGVALTVQALARGLCKLGHAVQVIRPRRPDEPARVVDVDFCELLVNGAALPHYPGLRFGLPAQKRLIRHWQDRLPDALYVATEGPLGHSALAAARRLGIPACTGFHTRFDDFARHYGLSWLTPLVFAGMRRFHNRAAATLVPTAELATFLGQRGFRNVRLLRRAVDTSAFHPAYRDRALRAHWGVADGALAVVHVGRLAAEKNLELAVRAYHAILQEQPDARFIIVGDGPSARAWPPRTQGSSSPVCSVARILRATTRAPTCSFFQARPKPSATSRLKRWRADFRSSRSITAPRANISSTRATAPASRLPTRLLLSGSLLHSPQTRHAEATCVNAHAARCKPWIPRR